MTDVIMDVNKLANQITLTVRMVGVNKFRLRLYLARQLFRLGAWIAHMNIIFDEKADL
jgi:hypothetical protein